MPIICSEENRGKALALATSILNCHNLNLVQDQVMSLAEKRAVPREGLGLTEPIFCPLNIYEQ